MCDLGSPETARQQPGPRPSCPPSLLENTLAFSVLRLNGRRRPGSRSRRPRRPRPARFRFCGASSPGGSQRRRVSGRQAGGAAGSSRGGPSFWTVLWGESGVGGRTESSWQRVSVPGQLGSAQEPGRRCRRGAAGRRRRARRAAEAATHLALLGLRKGCSGAASWAGGHATFWGPGPWAVTACTASQTA